MKFLRQGICLLVLGGGLAAVPGITATAQAPAPAADRSFVERMRDDADGNVTFTREKSTGKVGFIRVSRGGDLLESEDAKGPQKSREYVDKYARAFGARPGELLESEISHHQGRTTVTYVQKYKGVPVFGAMVRAHLDRQGDLTAVNGYAAPDLNLDVSPRVSAAEAARLAVDHVIADPPGQDHGHGKAADAPAGLKAAKTDLVVYRTGAIKGVAGVNKLVYVVEVTNRSTVRDVVFIDAQSRKLVNRYSLVHDALDRELYETSPDPANLVWKEGDPLPGTLTADQESMVRSTGDAYWFFHNTFGRDSYDDAGATMKTVNNDPTINCPNANWNGETTNYCDGVSSDDVVAHEWGHAYTEYTHNLIYQWQPGALNEAYSDIWGETVDLINDRLDGDEGDFTAKRIDGACSTHSPGLPLLTINAPAEIAKDCDTGGALFGPQLDATGVTGDVVMGLDADEDADNDPNPFDLQGSIYDGCSAFTNGAALVGKVVMLNRGLCGFEAKARNADSAGAIAVIIANRNDNEVFTMSGDVDPDPAAPSVMIDRIDRTSIADALGAAETVNVTMKDAGGVREDSFRWLMGEDSAAFGGAIRDMWTPTCYGDPGKVTDAQYVCSTDDAGGVHSNSGVPNHAYALTVDGGTYNGHTITGLGLTKAAAIYFNAMTTYQTPTTDFVDHADSLAASCTDLVGQPLQELSTAADDSVTSAETISAGDCGTLAEVAAAVELRTEPDQCNFQPLLDPNAPAVCGPGFKENVVWKEDFEDGLAGWGTDQEVVYDGASGSPWVAESALPGGRSGTAAYGPAPDQGKCDGSADDFSSRDSIISPVVELPGSVGKSPRLTFQHYVATELGYDGGNVKIKVNDGDWAVIEKEAYVFNAMAGELQPAEVNGNPNNTNPMAGEDGFTGTDGGEVTGSWGESQVDLAKAGAQAGDTVQFRFDIGRDGCGGLDGWYVDDIKVSTCKIKVQVNAAQVPSPSQYGTASRVDFTIERDGTSGEAPNGVVVLKKANGTVVGKDSVVEGEASIALPSTLRVGTRTFVATFSGAGTSFANETADVPVRVKRATSTTTARPTTSTVTKGEAFFVRVRVTAAGLTPGRVVRIFKGTTVLASGTLSDGVVRIKVPTTHLAVARHTLVAKYGGSPRVAPSQDSFAITVVR